MAGQAGDLHQTHGTAALMWAVVARIVRRVFRRRQLGHDHDRPEDQAASSSSHVRRIVRTPESQEVNWAAIDAREAVGADGELRVRELLSERLPAGMLILNNLELPELGGDIDLLIVGSTGLFVAEVKAWSGAIRCSPDGRRWSRITDWRRAAGATRSGRAGKAGNRSFASLLAARGSRAVPPHGIVDRRLHRVRPPEGARRCSMQSCARALS